MRKAVDALERHQTVSARLRHQVHLFGKPMAGSGAYLQGPWQRKLLRLELKLQVGNRLTSLLQVCDGKRLWTHSTLWKEPVLTKVELRKIVSESPAAPMAPLVNALGLGGLPRLMRSLERSFEFGEFREGSLDDVPVLVVRGDWKPGELVRLLPEQQQSISADPRAARAPLPPQMPHHVVICFGRDDLFPYRIEYWPAPSAPGGETTPLGKPAPPMPLVRLEFFEVRLNEPIDTRQFVYLPGSQEVDDVTGKFLRKLKERRPPP